MATTEERAEKAEQIRLTARTTIEGLRGNSKISDSEKRRLMANAWVTMRDALDALKDSAGDATRKRRTELERKLYGIPNPSDASAAISYRDALDRAMSLSYRDESEAVALMNRAETSGDSTLARALLATAYEREWVDVINTYRRAHDNLDADMHELWKLQTNPAPVEMFTYVPLNTPPELSGLSELRIRATAEGE